MPRRTQQLYIRLAPGFRAGGGVRLDELGGRLLEGIRQAPQIGSNEAKTLFGPLRRFLDPPGPTENLRHRLKDLRQIRFEGVGGARREAAPDRHRLLERRERLLALAGIADV